MITAQSRFRAREEEVAAKVMDGEAILINLSNGIYYSMDKAGGLVWEMVEGRRSVEEMAACIVARYEVSAEQARADLERLMEELVQENLVTEAEEGTAGSGVSEPAVTERLPYEAPKLNIYRDMGDLLALDPPTPGLQDLSWKENEEESNKKS
jgi:Coenzyme PQQ synthesis protein D (PqqD)